MEVARDLAFAKLRRSSPKLGFAERRRVLLRAHDLLLERGDLLLDLAQLESGKTRGQALEELYQAASVTRYNALTAHRVLRGRTRRAGVPLASTTRVRYRAKGVVGVITPWNYALSLAAMDVVRDVCSAGSALRKAAGLRNRLPLSSLTVVVPDAAALAGFDAEELVAVGVHLEPDVVARFDVHQGHLQVLPGPQRRPVVLVGQCGRLDVGDERVRALVGRGWCGHRVLRESAGGRRVARPR